MPTCRGTMRASFVVTRVSLGLVRFDDTAQVARRHPMLTASTLAHGYAASFASRPSRL